MSLTKTEANKLRELINKRVSDELQLREMNRTNDETKNQIEKYLEDLTNKQQ